MLLRASSIRLRIRSKAAVPPASSSKVALGRPATATGKLVNDIGSRTLT